MEIIAFLLFSGAAALWWSIRRSGRKRDRDERPRDGRGRFLDPDDAPREGSGTRVFWEPDFARPPGIWKRFPGRHEVRGVAFRRTEVLAFLSAAKRSFENRGKPLDLTLHREPGNAVDPNAIAVFGASDGRAVQLGYLAQEVAAEIALAAPPDMPLAAVVTRIAFAGQQVYIRFDLLVPAKASPYWRDKPYPFGRDG